MKKNTKKSWKRVTLFDVLLATVLLVVAYVTLYPFLIVVFTSISNPTDLLKNPLILYPRSFYLTTYKVALFDSGNMGILNGFKNSTVYTATYTFLLVMFTTAAAYPLSIKAFKARKFLLWLFIIPWFFGGGLIPTYLIVTGILGNSMWAFVLPGIVGAFNLILVRTFIEQLPGELFEAAIIDGANDLRIFFKLVIPLSTPIIATIALWAAVGQWNNYFGPLLYLNDPKDYNLQVTLRNLIQETMLAEMLNRAQMGVTDPGSLATMRSQLKSDSLKAAVIVISTIPILAVYPFVQRYFVKGIMIGAIKG